MARRDLVRGHVAPALDDGQPGGIVVRDQQLDVLASRRVPDDRHDVGKKPPEIVGLAGRGMKVIDPDNGHERSPDEGR